jgi:hypothetical protein
MKEEKKRMMCGKEMEGSATSGIDGPVDLHSRSACPLLLAPADIQVAGLHYSPSSSPPFMTRSADDIQRHLYASLLHARTPDVTLRVRASWHATYKLHRVILIQAGFFNSLFTAGFAESSPKPDVIDIIFDDTNITRAGVYGTNMSFSIC